MSRKVLVVEDDAIAAIHISKLLQQLECVTLGPVPSGEEAIAIVKKEIPDAVLMDIRLKGELTGIQTATEILKIIDVPIIYLTAFTDKDTIRNSSQTHSYGFLSKPIRDRELQASLETAISKSEMDKALKHLNRILRAVRNIEKLITSERDETQLLNKACDTLLTTQEYSAVWINNFSKENKSLFTVSFSSKDDYLSKNKIESLYTNKQLIELYNELYINKTPQILNKELTNLFLDNRINQTNNITVSISILPLHHKDNFFGFLHVILDSPFLFDDEETELLNELSEDLAFALYSIGLEKEQQIFQQKLIEKESYYRSLLHSMYEDIIVIDKDYNIVDTNNSVLKSVGLKTNEVIGKKCYQITHGLLCPCNEKNEECFLQDVFKDGQARYHSHIHKNKYNEEIYVDVVLSPIKDEEGKVIKVIESIRDVTKLKTTQEALKESEEKLRQLADNIDSVLFTITTENGEAKINYLSPAFEKIWGLKRTDVYNNPGLIEQTVHPLDRNEVSSKIKRLLLEDGELNSLSFRIIRPDGLLRHIDTKINVVKNSVTGSKQIFGIAENTTEKILMKEKLKQSEQGYKNLFENAHDPIIIFEVQQGTIIDLNKQACNVYGYPRKALLGRSVFSLCKDPELFKEKLYEYTLQNNFQSFEIVNHNKDGKEIYFEINTATADYMGQKVVLSIQRDITYKKSVENELNILSEIVKQSPASVLLTDINGKITYVNQQFSKLTGYSFGEVIGTNPRVLKNDDQDKIVFKELWNKIVEGKVWQGELLNKKKNGEPYWASATISPIKNNDGETTHYLSIEQDITDRKELEINLKLALHKANEISNFKSYLLGNLSHEIRTPMNAIIGFSQILKEEIEDQSKVEMIEKILRSSFRLLNTLNAIIELSDLESNRIKVFSGEVNMTEFAKYLDYSFSNRINEKGLSLYIKVTHNNLVAYSDEKLLEQIVKNLMDNAIKFTDSGSISVYIDKTTDHKGIDYIAIKIKDTGIGINKIHLSQIFDAFRQVSEGSTRKYEGTGLGLTVASKMIELLGGKIEVESELGKGSTFTVLVPAVNYTSDSSEDTQETKPDQNVILDSVNNKLLLVEDNIMNIEVIKYYLKDIAVIEFALNFENALEKIKTEDFDLYLLDINLQNKNDGVKLMKEIRNLKPNLNKPIIALTGYASAADKERFINGGFTDHIAKPVEKNQLIETVKTALNKK